MSPLTMQIAVIVALMADAAPFVEATQAEGFRARLPGAPRANAATAPAAASGFAGTSNHACAAAYAPEAARTFFTYLDAGHEETSAASPVAVASFDHKTRTVGRPVLLKMELDPQQRAVLSLAIDARGFVWVSAGGLQQPAAVFRSVQVYNVEAFRAVRVPELSQGIVHAAGEHGLLMLGLQTTAGGGQLSYTRSPDGDSWTEPRPLANLASGHVFISGQQQKKVGVAFATYRADEGPEQAGDLYYLETIDGGQTWQRDRRSRLEPPLQGENPPARVWDYRPAARTVHLKDLVFDPMGNAIILYLTARTIGRDAPACVWTTSRWIGREWETTGIIRAAGWQDAGVLHAQPDRGWRLVTVRNAAPVTAESAALVAWSSDDQGRSWYKLLEAGGGERDRHAVCRPAQAQPELDTLWITAPEATPSPARVEFLDREGRVFRLPARMSGATEQPLAGTQTTRPATRNLRPGSGAHD